MMMTMSSHSFAQGALQQQQQRSLARNSRPARVLRASRPAVQRVVAYKEDDNGKSPKTIVEEAKKGFPSPIYSAEANEQKSSNLGGSYDKDAVQVVEVLPSFTRRREIFTGRLAMLGFVAAWVGEVVTGQGIIGQVQQWTGLSEMAVVALLTGLVGINAVGGLWPNGPTFSDENQKDIQKRPAGPVQEAMDPFTQPQQWLGVSSWGFTKLNELFNGRIAMLGFALAVVAELNQHRGPIGQLAYYFDRPVDYGLAASALGVWTLVAFGIAYAFGNRGELRGGKDIY